jgi:hypothetical protein
LTNQGRTFSDPASFNNSRQLQKVSLINFHNKMIYSMCVFLSTATYFRSSLVLNNKMRNTHRDNTWETYAWH